MDGSSYHHGKVYKACAICKGRDKGDWNGAGWMQPVVGSTVGGEDILGCGHIKPQGRAAIELAAPPDNAPVN